MPALSSENKLTPKKISQVIPKKTMSHLVSLVQRVFGVVNTSAMEELQISTCLFAN